MADYVNIVTVERFPCGLIHNGRVIPWEFPRYDLGHRIPEGSYHQHVENFEYDEEEYDDEDDEDDDDFYFPPDAGVGGPPPISTDGVWRRGIDYDIDSDSDPDPSSDSPEYSGTNDIERSAPPSKDDDDEPSLDLDLLPRVPKPSKTSEVDQADRGGVVATVDHNPLCKMARTNPPIRMMDFDALNDVVNSNLQSPEINSILVFQITGAILAHSSTSYRLRELRRLASTCGSTYTIQQDSATAGTAGIAEAAAATANQLQTLTPATSRNDGGTISSMLLEFEDNTVLVSRVAPNILLAVAGPRQLPRKPQPREKTKRMMINGDKTHDSFSDDAEPIHSSGEQQHSTEPVPRSEGDETDINGDPSGYFNDADNDDHDSQITSSASSSTSSKQKHRSLEGEREQQGQDDLAPNPSSSPIVIEALERKSEALTTYLRGFLGELSSTVQ